MRHAATDLATSLGHLTKAGGKYSRQKATNAGSALARSDVAEQTRQGVDRAREATRSAGRRLRRWTTLGLVAGMVMAYRKVTSMPPEPPQG